MPDFDDLEKEFLEDADAVDESEFAETGKLIPTVSSEERKKRRETMEKRTGKDLERKWQQEDRKAIAEAESLAAPPVINNPQCQVCQSPHRVWIERKLIQGWAYSQIAREIPDGPSRKSIANHAKEHLPGDSHVVRQLMEEEADILGQNAMDSVRGAFTLRGSLEVLIRKGFQDALDGTTTVEPRDLIAMMKQLNELNTNSGTAAYEEANTAISIFKEALQNVLLKGEGDVVERELGVKILLALETEVERLKAALSDDNDNRYLQPGDGPTE